MQHKKLLLFFFTPFFLTNSLSASEKWTQIKTKRTKKRAKQQQQQNTQPARRRNKSKEPTYTQPKIRQEFEIKSDDFIFTLAEVARISHYPKKREEEIKKIILAEREAAKKREAAKVAAQNFRIKSRHSSSRNAHQGPSAFSVPDTTNLLLKRELQRLAIEGKTVYEKSTPTKQHPKRLTEPPAPQQTPKNYMLVQSQYPLFLYG